MSISSLPNELLQLIFRTVRDNALSVNEQDMSWMLLARVSRTWRDALHGDPLLWTQLAFNEDTPFSAVEAALSRSQQVGGLDLKFDAGSSPADHYGWLAMMSIGWPLGTYSLPEKVRILSFRWHKSLQDTMFDCLESLRADGVVSLTLEEYKYPEDPDSDDDEVFSESSSDDGSLVSGHETEAESESESDPETGSGDDEDDSGLDSDDEEYPNDEDADSEGSDSEGSDADGYWNGSESDYAGSEDESSSISIPDAVFGLDDDDSSTYLDSESDGGKRLGALDDESEATGAQTRGDHDSDREVLSEDTTDIDETDSDVSDNAVELVQVRHTRQPPRLLELPLWPSLINLDASSILLKIPLEVRQQLTDMTLKNTSRRAQGFKAAGVVQSWLLDVLQDCVQLGGLRLCETLGVEHRDPEDRTVALPNLKLLCVEDLEGGVQDTLRFLKTSPEALTRVDLRTLFDSAEDWVPEIDGAFVGNLPVNLTTPYFADTVALNLRVDDEFVLQGRRQASGSDSTSELRQWEMRGTCIPEGWAVDDLNRFVIHAVLDLWDHRIVATSDITTLTIHIAPGYLTHEVHWADLISGLPHVRKFALGSDEAVGTFLGATSPERKLKYWPDLTELYFCIASLRWNLPLSLRILCAQLWSGLGTQDRRLDVKVFLRLPGFIVPWAPGTAVPDWFGCPHVYRGLELLRDEWWATSNRPL